MTSTPSTESANGSAATGGVQSQFVERRRAALERFLNRVAQHPVLSIDPDFREFLESGQYTSQKLFFSLFYYNMYKWQYCELPHPCQEKK